MANTRYVALLRGINVGGIRIKMPDLKARFEALGCRAVTTYLQTGNVVFEDDRPPAELKAVLERGLSETFRYEAYVLLYEHSGLASVISNYPFERDDAHHAYVVFVNDAASLVELADQSRVMDEPLSWGDGLVYWKVVKGQTLDTPFSKLIAKAKYKKCTTTRNVNTLELILG